MELHRATNTAAGRGVRTLALATAAVGTAELGLHRVVAPALAHIPGAARSVAVTDALTWAGERAFAGTAVLAVSAALAAGAVMLRDRRPLGALVLVTVIVTLIDGATAGVGFAFAGHVFALAAMVAIAGDAARSGGPSSRLSFAALGLTALGLGAAQWPLLVDSWSALIGGPAASGSALMAWTLAEAALVAAPVGFALAVLAAGTPTRLAWGAATAAALLAGAFLGAEPGYAGIIAIWATGSALALPPFAYVLSAACAALVLATWLRSSSSRHLAAGLVLVAVAGVQPAVVHHNLTAVLALLLLAAAAPGHTRSSTASPAERVTVRAPLRAVE